MVQFDFFFFCFMTLVFSIHNENEPSYQQAARHNFFAITITYMKLPFLSLPDAKLCKERREPSRWLYVPRGLEGPCPVL